MIALNHRKSIRYYLFLFINIQFDDLLDFLQENKNVTSFGVDLSYDLFIDLSNNCHVSTFLSLLLEISDGFFSFSYLVIFLNEGRMLSDFIVLHYRCHSFLKSKKNKQ